ncbi:MAG: hypothetical protein JJU02_03945 [Cryomorphaceae bacterium]|nr:hypothetical protein [Cryomorphaceae bacterium]
MKVINRDFFGVYIGLALIGYFILMGAFDLQELVFLRIFNLPIVLGGLVLLYHKMFVRKRGKYTIRQGIIQGVRAVCIATLMLVSYIYGHIQADPSFLNFVNELMLFGFSFSIYQMGIILFIEGVFTGLMLSLVLMVWYRKGAKSRVKEPISN